MSDIRFHSPRVLPRRGCGIMWAIMLAHRILPNTASIALSLVLLLASLASAFDGHKVTQGPLTLTIEPIDTVTKFDSPIDISITLQNANATPLKVAVTIGGLVEPWRVAGVDNRVVEIPGKGKATAAFQIVAPKGAYSALYPVHAEALFDLSGHPTKAHAVLVFKTDFEEALAADAPREPPLVNVPTAGALPLATLKTSRMAWQYFNQPMNFTRVGFNGADEASGANMSRSPMQRGGETRQAIQMHPPYRNKVGTAFAEFRVQLPDARPIRLAFANAIRDTGPKEPASDGVTFRAWVDDKAVFERHTDSKNWVPGEADLSDYAGKPITLRLECHPGPKNNTVCDSAFWGDPILFVGQAPKVATPQQRKETVAAARALLTRGVPPRQDAVLFSLSDNAKAAVVLGPSGLADGAIAFADGGKTIAIDGFNITILDTLVGRWPSAMVVESVSTTRDAAGRLVIVHKLKLDRQSFDLTATLWKQGPALRIKFDCPQRISRIEPGPFNEPAARIYAGHAYCIDKPDKFSIHAGGHELAANHVAADFANGPTLLVATDVPPDSFEVDSSRNVAALTVHPGATYTFIPSAAGACDAALKFRPIPTLKASPGVAKKAGRFVFDYWGGQYAGNTALLSRAFDYGLTDSLVVIHTWQRWGYDYRLPDIYPPNPNFGTLEQFQAQAKLCADRGVLWGPHDNYIDIYPDADGYTYDNVSFDANGKPRRAWFNSGRDALSYQFRPDRIMPFVKRNMDLIVPNLKPTTYFVDVFTSAGICDFYDRAGQFHSRVETQKHWGEAMAAMRIAMGNNAPVISEAGAEQLIGYVDGADCQIVRISDKGGFFIRSAKVADWSLVPWFDTLHHDRFSLHGAGYSDRYQGGRSRSLHGIDSDDYISAEILTGHSLMTDLSSGLRGATRKYWLAQPFARHIAHDTIARWEQEPGNIHHITVHWNSGATVRVNRGTSDWKIDGHVLPQFGYIARTPQLQIQSSIQKIGDAVVERCNWPGGFYVNARGPDRDSPQMARPAAGTFVAVAPRSFKLPINWDVQSPLDPQAGPFLHLFKPRTSYFVKREGFFATMGNLPRPFGPQKGQVITGADHVITLPENLTAGRYDVLVGVTIKGRRTRILGDEQSDRTYRIGTLVAEGKNQAITALRFEPSSQSDPLADRLIPNPPVDFGNVKTAGALRCVTSPGKLTITPLPDGLPFDVNLRLDAILGVNPGKPTPPNVKLIQAVDAKGARTRDVQFKQDKSEVTFTTSPDDFAYEVLLAE